MKTLFKSINSLNNHDDEDDQSTGVNCNYYQIDELSRETVRKGKFSLLHLNIASLGAHKDEFEDMLSILDLMLMLLVLLKHKLLKVKILTLKHLLMDIKTIIHQLKPITVVLHYILVTI